MKSCLGWDFSKTIDWNPEGASKGKTYYLATQDNGSILGTQSGGTETVIPTTNVPSATIITETNFKKYLVTGQTYTQKVSDTKSHTFSGDYFDVKKYNSSGKVTKDYNVRFWLSKSVNASGANVSTYDASSADAKATIRWFFTKLPLIFDRIEEATGFRPGYPFRDQWNGAKRHIVWNALQPDGICVSGFQYSGFQSIGRTLQIKPITDAANVIGGKKYTTFGTPSWNYVDQTNSTTISKSLALLANAGGPLSKAETYADTVCHEMMHFVQFMNRVHGMGGPRWVTEGWADLIRGALMSRRLFYYTKHDYGTWGMLFFGYKVGSKTFKYDTILNPTTNFLDKSVTEENNIRHVDYAAGNAFYHFLCTSVINGWDQDYRKSKHSINKDTIKAS